MDELRLASWFVQVVHADGFSAASRALGKSPSVLSRGVAELEEALGVELLVRTTRRIHLTDAGSIYLAHAEGLLRAQQQAHDAVHELRGAPRGKLRVTMPVTLGERLVATQLARFRAEHPDLRLEIDLSDRVIALVEEGYDLAIRVGRPPDSTLKAQLLGRIAVTLVASPAYLKAHGTPTHPSEITGHECIAIGAVGAPVEWSFFKGTERVSFAVEPQVHTTSAELAVQLACDGLGLLRTLDWLVDDELRVGKLVEVLPRWHALPPGKEGVPIFALYGTNGPPPLKARVFVEFLKGLIADERVAVTQKEKQKQSARSPPTPRAPLSPQLGGKGGPRR